jgi:subtilisin family serine protease
MSKVSINTNQTIEVIVLYGEKFQTVNEYITSIGAKLQDLGYGYGIVTINIADVDKLVQNPDLQYIELPTSLYLTDAASNRAACVDRARNSYGVSGEGIVIGFVDSGIDYTHPAFKKEDGTTRIEYIYDLSLEGAIYDKNLINQALKNQDPFSIVPSYDVIEHGTHVVGIACAGGKIDPKYYGVAPKSSIMMVKSARGNFTLSTQIMRGLKFLVDKANELGMPLVVNLSLSTNDGAHKGTSLLEQYINTIASLERVTIVVAAGNEGSAAHHVGGIIEAENTIKFNVAEDETAVVINLYKSVLSGISLELITPTGATTGPLIVEEGYKEGVISRNRYQIYNTGPRPFDINGEIGISLISGGNYILSGEWTILIKLLNRYKGLYEMWLPIAEGLNEKTKFLSPTTNNTLGIPATVNTVISVGSYNYITRMISSFSGRGALRLYGELKPDVVAPGEGISSAIPNGSYDMKTGTSMASPHVAGICALMMEWGIVKKNDPFLYGNRLKYYLIMGAKRDRTDVIYPDPSWGYGEVCVNDSFQVVIDALDIISTSGPENRERKVVSKYKEYIIGSLFIRYPEI